VSMRPAWRGYLRSKLRVGSGVKVEKFQMGWGIQYMVRRGKEDTSLLTCTIGRLPQHVLSGTAGRLGTPRAYSPIWP